MKKLARSVLFFTFSFVLFLIFFVLFRFLGFWIESIQSVSMNPEQGISLIEIINLALPETLFFSILFSLSYSVRNKVFAPLSILIIFLLSGAFCLGFYTGIERLEVMDIPLFSKSPVANGKTETRSGIILSRQDMDMVLLKENTGFPRVVSFPESRLIYQEAAIGRDADFFDLRIGDKTPWFFQSLLLDFNMTARELDSRYDEGLASFLLYGLSLIFLLVSLRFLFGLSAWPAANLFLGAIIFRAVLSLEIFLIAPETMAIIRSFLSDRVNDSLIPPFIFIALGALIFIYTFLSFMARRKRRNDA